MSQIFRVHPDNPQARLIKQATELIRKGAVVIYPTDSSYALGCHIGDKKALDRVRQIRKLSEKHNLTLICRDLSDIAVYAKVNNISYRLLKAYTPGPYTFLLNASGEVPRRLQHPKRKTIGLRIPEHNIAQALLEELGEPLLSTTLILPGEEFPLSDPEEIYERLDNVVDLIIDGGWGGIEATTVVDITENVPELIRSGLGDPSPFQ